MIPLWTTQGGSLLGNKMRNQNDFLLQGSSLSTQNNNDVESWRYQLQYNIHTNYIKHHKHLLKQNKNIISQPMNFSHIELSNISFFFILSPNHVFPCPLTLPLQIYFTYGQDPKKNPCSSTQGTRSSSMYLTIYISKINPCNNVSMCRFNSFFGFFSQCTYRTQDSILVVQTGILHVCMHIYIY